MQQLTIQQLRTQISKGLTNEALEAIVDVLSEKNRLYDKFIMLKGQWASAKEEERLGLENSRNLGPTFARITDATLNFLKELSDSDFNKTNNEAPKLRERGILTAEENANFSYDIFLSFSTKNIEEARDTCEALRGYGLRIFFSADGMRSKAGHQFSEVIDEALEKSRHFLLFCTPEAMAASWVIKEYRSFHDAIHMKDATRKFLIFEGKGFQENLLPLTYRSNQRVRDVENILDAVLVGSEQVDFFKKIQEQRKEAERKQAAAAQAAEQEAQRQREADAKQAAALALAAQNAETKRQREEQDRIEKARKEREAKEAEQRQRQQRAEAERLAQIEAKRRAETAEAEKIRIEKLAFEQAIAAGNSHYGNAEWAQAKTAFQKAISLYKIGFYPDPAQLKNQIADCDNALQADKYVALAKPLYQAKEYKNATNYIKKALKERPNHAAALRLRDDIAREYSPFTPTSPNAKYAGVAIGLFLLSLLLWKFCGNNVQNSIADNPKEPVQEVLSAADNGATTDTEQNKAAENSKTYLESIKNEQDKPKNEAKKEPEPATKKAEVKRDPVVETKPKETKKTPPAPPKTNDPFEGQMVYVQGGTFQMGSNDYGHEKPIHSVTLSSYKIGKYEVTQGQWYEIMGTTIDQQRLKANGGKLYGEGNNYPMYYVSWNDIQEFIKKLNAKTGKNYRLPTEAEYAARGGTKSSPYKYAGSDDVGSVAWYNGNASSKTHAVGGREANSLGLYDMSGNVYEWCSDRYGSDYYANSPAKNPKGPSSGNSRVLRGGSWGSLGNVCRVAYRYNLEPSFRNSLNGFRLAQD